MPFVEKPPVTFRVPGHFDRFAPPNGKLTGRIVLGKDFDGFLGTGMKLYICLLYTSALSEAEGVGFHNCV